MVTGTSVQITSSLLLWVVREGLGFLFSANRQQMKPPSKKTKRQMTTTTGIRTLSWKVKAWRAMDEAGAGNPVCQSFATPALATPAFATPATLSPAPSSANALRGRNETTAMTSICASFRASIRTFRMGAKETALMPSL